LRGKRVALITLLLVALLAYVGLWLRAKRRQYALNRQLIAALVKGDDKQALALVNEGADPNTRYKPTPMRTLPSFMMHFFHRSPPVNNTPTALMIGCGAEWLDDSAAIEALPERPDAPQLVEAMLKHGANINAREKDGLTPLQWATMYNRRNTVWVLLEHGADVNVKDRNEWTALMTAAALDTSPDVVLLLLDHGADVNARDDKSNTPLLEAAQFHVDPYMVRLLLTHGANVNARNDYALTPLMYAVRYNRPDAVRLLLDYGAVINAQDEIGRTALHWAVLRSSYQSLVRFAAPTTQDRRYQVSMNKDIIRQLLAHGADPSLADHHGNTSLTLARNRKRPDLIVLLKQAGARK
jgi:uncharacterized protein